MKIRVQMAVMSHLSDVQEMLNLAANNEYVRKKVNFVKAMVLEYPDLLVEVEEKELNELWCKTVEGNG